MAGKLNEAAFGYAGASVSALGMLLLGLLGNLGLYSSGVRMMMDRHMFFSLSPLGIITGMIEAAVIGYVFSYAFVLLYNKFV